MSKHTKKFFRKKYNQLKRYAQREDLVFPYKSVREFESDWNAISVTKNSAGERKYNNVYGFMKYELEYPTHYKTALAEKKMLDDLDIEHSYKLSDFKTMTTTEFAELYKKEIMNAYDTYKKEHPEATTSEAKRFISAYWFGSE